MKTTEKQKDKFRDKLEKDNLNNEILWNYLVGSVLEDSNKQQEFVRAFTDESTFIDDLDVWYESQPLHPLVDEGNSIIDLAFGGIAQRGKTGSGIEYSINGKCSWVCFVEGKLFSDCSTQVTHYPLRNQLIRVIENLLCFQKNGKYPDKIFFTLLTPRLFKENKTAKLYGYKMEEYADKENILRDIVVNDKNIVNRKNWIYPDIEKRIDKLKLNWVTYEEILEREYGLDGLDLTELDEYYQFFIDEMKDILNTVL